MNNNTAIAFGERNAVGSALVIALMTGGVLIGEIVRYEDDERDPIWTLIKVASVVVSGGTSSSAEVGFRPIAVFSATPWAELAWFHGRDILVSYGPAKSMEDAWLSAVTGLEIAHVAK